VIARAVVAAIALAGCAAALEQSRRNEADVAACDRGDAVACLQVGRTWRGAAESSARDDSGRWASEAAHERERSLTAYDRACGARIVAACAEGAAFFDDNASPFEQQHPELRTRMEARACELGAAETCIALARRHGVTAPRRAELATILCDRAIERCADAVELAWDSSRVTVAGFAARVCRAGRAADCHRVAGYGFDDADRIPLLAASCDLGELDDCYTAGSRERATGQLDAAVAHLRVACARSHAAACEELGAMRAAGQTQ
jgi:hypothetical protein